MLVDVGKTFVEVVQAITSPVDVEYMAVHYG